MENERIILKLLAENYRLINALGYKFNVPIFIVTDNNVDTLLQGLGIKEISIPISERISRKHYIEYVTDETPGFIALQYADYNSVREFINSLTQDMQAGIVEAGEIYKLPIILMKSIPFGVNTENAFIVQLPEYDYSNVLRGFDTIDDEDVGMIIDRIFDITKEAKSSVEKVLKAACCFAYPINNGELYKTLLVTVDKMLKFDADNKSLSGIEEVFQSCMYDWQMDTGFNEVYLLPNLGMEVVKDIDNIICYDEQYLYMKDTLFDKIKSYHLKTFGSDVVKRALLEEGVLVADNAALNTYTSKMNFINISGQMSRIRMLRFDINKINRAGDIDFIQLCFSTKGGNKDDIRVY